jgi:hypothetical protein
MNKSDILKTVKSDLENEDINNAGTDSENEDNDNIIIQNFSISGDKRVEVSSMLSTLLAQREVDQRRFIALNKKNAELEVENSKLDMKLHYLKLDLTNAEIKNEELVSIKKCFKNTSKELEDIRKKMPRLEAKSFVLNILTMFFCILGLFIVFLAGY